MCLKHSVSYAYITKTAAYLKSVNVKLNHLAVVTYSVLEQPTILSPNAFLIVQHLSTLTYD